MGGNRSHIPSPPIKEHLQTAENDGYLEPVQIILSSEVDTLRQVLFIDLKSYTKIERPYI